MNYNKTLLPDFEEFKKSIATLNYKDQLTRLIIERTKYMQTCNRNLENILEVPFDEKCKLEIQMIKDLIDLDNR